jgi:ATP-dependent DNA ligase
MNGADWSGRYPLIVEEAAKLNVTAIMDAEVICTSGDGVPSFEKLHSRLSDDIAFACAFDLLMVGGEDLRHWSFAKRKAALRKLLKADRGGIQYIELAEGHGDKMFAATCDLGLEGIVSKKLDMPYRSGPRKVGSKSRIRRPRQPRVFWKATLQ